MQCSIADCQTEAYARGWCASHYHRWHRKGDPTSERLRPWGRGRHDAGERFWSKVSRGEGCWVWTAYVHHTGYGYFKLDGKALGAHRVSWMLTNGPVPDGLVVMHECDNPVCVRPDHLRLGTDGDNAADRDRKGRNINYRGAANGRSKLSTEAADDIRGASLRGESARGIARRYQVSKSTIADVLSGRRWQPEQSADGSQNGRESERSGR